MKAKSKFGMFEAIKSDCFSYLFSNDIWTEINPKDEELLKKLYGVSLLFEKETIPPVEEKVGKTEEVVMSKKRGRPKISTENPETPEVQSA